MNWVSFPYDVIGWVKHIQGNWKGKGSPISFSTTLENSNFPMTSQLVKKSFLDRLKSESGDENLFANDEIAWV